MCLAKLSSMIDCLPCALAYVAQDVLREIQQLRRVAFQGIKHRLRMFYACFLPWRCVTHKQSTPSKKASDTVVVLESHRKVAASHFERKMAPRLQDTVIQRYIVTS